MLLHKNATFIVISQCSFVNDVGDASMLWTVARALLWTDLVYHPSFVVDVGNYDLTQETSLSIELL